MKKEISTGTSWVIIFAIFILSVAVIYVYSREDKILVGNSKKLRTETGLKHRGDYISNDDGIEYAGVRLSEGQTYLYFEVPDGWAVETRNSGERKMTNGEMMDFLRTNVDETGKNYSDMTDEELAKLGPEDIRREIQDFPNASVAEVDDDGAIVYSDWNANQIDFNFVSTSAAEKEKTGIKQDAKDFLAYNPYEHTFKWLWSMENVGGYEADTVTFPLGLDSAGRRSPTVELTGGKIYFITIGDTGKTLIIKKQGRGDERFEKDFNHMIESLEFKPLDS